MIYVCVISNKLICYRMSSKYSRAIKRKGLTSDKCCRVRLKHKTNITNRYNKIKQPRTIDNIGLVDPLICSDDENYIGPDGHAIPDDTWKRFTPTAIDATRCQSRVWKNGHGGQCTNRPFSIGYILCSNHQRQHDGPFGLTHGYVTGMVPQTKLSEFMRREMRRRQPSVSIRRKLRKKK